MPSGVFTMTLKKLTAFSQHFLKAINDAVQVASKLPKCGKMLCPWSRVSFTPGARMAFLERFPVAAYVLYRDLRPRRLCLRPISPDASEKETSGPQGKSRSEYYSNANTCIEFIE